MYVQKINKGQVIIDLTEDELGLLGNCLNEICHGIKVLDFESKIGIEKQTAQLMLKDISKIYKIMDQKIEGVEDC